MTLNIEHVDDGTVSPQCGHPHGTYNITGAPPILIEAMLFGLGFGPRIGALPIPPDDLYEQIEMWTLAENLRRETEHAKYDE
jgi:hypothetical protein